MHLSMKPGMTKKGGTVGQWNLEREISYLGTREVVFCQVLLSSCDIVFTTEQWVGYGLDCFPSKMAGLGQKTLSQCVEKMKTHSPECLAQLYRGHFTDPERSYRVFETVVVHVEVGRVCGAADLRDVGGLTVAYVVPVDA